MIFLNKYPSIKLNSGIRIVNFSSPHKYVFHTGEVLDACTREVSKHSMLDENHLKTKNAGGWYDININYDLPGNLFNDLIPLSELSIIDVILVPYPTLNCLKEIKDALTSDYDVNSSVFHQILEKARTCKFHDRVTKVIRSDEFCV